MIFTNAAQAATPIATQIAQAQRILLLTHVNPDGDAIGSMLGIWHTLRALGKDAVPLASSGLPEYTMWLPGIEHVQVYQPGQALPEADLVVMSDTASLERVGRVYDEHVEALKAMPLIIIDHHVTNEGAGTINLIVPNAASTCELLYQLFSAMNIEVTPDTATALLIGIITDTQSFKTSATKPESLRTTAALLEHGADHDRVVREVYFAMPASSTILMGQALANMQHEGEIAWTTVSKAMLRATGAEDEAADEVVQAMQRVAGVKALVLFKERGDGTTKISLRSVPPFNVAALAQVWGGGGHTQAAGATLNMSPADAAVAVLPRLRALVEKPLVAEL